MELLYFLMCPQLLQYQLKPKKKQNNLLLGLKFPKYLPNADTQQGTCTTHILRKLSKAELKLTLGGYCSDSMATAWHFELSIYFNTRVPARALVCNRVLVLLHTCKLLPLACLTDINHTADQCAFTLNNLKLRLSQGAVVSNTS